VGKPPKTEPGLSCDNNVLVALVLPRDSSGARGATVNCVAECGHWGQAVETALADVALVPPSAMGRVPTVTAAPEFA